MFKYNLYNMGVYTTYKHLDLKFGAKMMLLLASQKETRFSKKNIAGPRNSGADLPMMVQFYHGTTFFGTLLLINKTFNSYLD